jgi:hypothetical protein
MPDAVDKIIDKLSTFNSVLTGVYISKNRYGLKIDYRKTYLVVTKESGEWELININNGIRYASGADDVRSYLYNITVNTLRNPYIIMPADEDFK